MTNEVGGIALHVSGSVWSRQEGRSAFLSCQTAPPWARAVIAAAPAGCVRVDATAAVVAAIRDGRPWEDELGIRAYEDRPEDQPDVVEGRQRVDAELSEAAELSRPRAPVDLNDLRAAVATMFFNTTLSPTQRIVLSWMDDPNHAVGCTTRD